jgi:hypothetical protein
MGNAEDAVLDTTSEQIYGVTKHRRLKKSIRISPPCVSVGVSLRSWESNAAGEKKPGFNIWKLS